MRATVQPQGSRPDVRSCNMISRLLLECFQLTSALTKFSSCCIGVCLEPRTTTIVTIPTTSSSAEERSTDIVSDNTRTFTKNHSTRSRIDPTTQIQNTPEPQTSSTSNVATGTETDSDVAPSTFFLPPSAIKTSTIFRTRSRDATLPTGPTFSNSAYSSLGTGSSSSVSSPSSADPSSISFRISSASIA